jgi:hypothetical protein
MNAVVGQKHGRIGSRFIEVICGKSILSSYGWYDANTGRDKAVFV